MNKQLNKLEQLSVFLLYVVGLALFVYAILSFKSKETTILLILISLTIQRIATNYKSPFSIKLRLIDYLFSMMLLSNLFVVENLVAFIVPALSYLAYMSVIAPQLYKKEAFESVEKTLQSKNPEDAKTAIFKLERIGAFKSDSDTHKQLLSICNDKEVMD